MVLLKLTSKAEEWRAVADAARIIYKANTRPTPEQLNKEILAFRSAQTRVTVLRTGLLKEYSVVTVRDGREIIIAFLGSTPYEMIQNMWYLPSPLSWFGGRFSCRVDGFQVHSFYHDMWNALQTAVETTLAEAVAELESTGAFPSQVTIAGYSMGGGVSTLAFTEILDFFRRTYGSKCANPRLWAQDENLCTLFKHITFAEFAAADVGYHTRLNELYDRYQIPAWDFVNAADGTRRWHIPHFRSWRGHRYEMPRAAVEAAGTTFGAQGHEIEGYFRAAEWMAEHEEHAVQGLYEYRGF